MSPDPEENNLEETVETLQELNQYDQEEFLDPRELELVENIVGPIKAFYKAAEELNQQTDLYLEDDHNEGELQQAVRTTGVAFPDAHQAYLTLQNYAQDEEIGNKVMAAAIRDEGVEQMMNAVTDLDEFETNYQEGYANMMAASHTLGPDQMQTPIDVAQRLAEEPETQEKLDEMDQEIPRSQEEAHQQLMQELEEI